MTSKSSTKSHYQILILGGGTAGITVAAQLRRTLKTYDLAIIELSTKHYGKLVLAEFDYEGKPKETFPFDQSKERLSTGKTQQFTLAVFQKI
jgi:protoporphyrinogen oxidase